MAKLSDTQAIVLAEASQRFDGNVLPLPGSLRGGAQAKVVGALLKRGLIEERPGQDHHEPDPALNTVWRNDDDGRAVRLYITKAGLAAIGCEPDDEAAAPATATEGAQGAPKAEDAPKASRRKKAAPDAPAGADGAKARGPVPAPSSRRSSTCCAGPRGPASTRSSPGLAGRRT